MPTFRPLRFSINEVFAANDHVYDSSFQLIFVKYYAMLSWFNYLGFLSLFSIILGHIELLKGPLNPI